ncbi:uncharacterized protein LOC119675271 isoform X2 [Teleopsis dalmanni]|uniref:uncharacterized protein LOC119670672 isoform X2 n=1 Tax=Teleopsis dalmanni TaxID=139649 RepID=UPI0018CFCCD1|nr:uncharacterized protein LOC119670672 isoform X2 [Teleopsis dalmanni]XP_037942393.1 uncharacterized protein LOC119675271 isoform X2 [Teleopsis dalmanni]
MQTLVLIKVFIFCLQQVLSINNPKFFFKQNPCQIHCVTTAKVVKHTSCISTDYKLPPCRVFAYDIKTFSQVNIMGQLIIGHNGLRDRIAEHMHISHMTEMFWSEELEAMAKRYAYKCNPFQDDYCASIDSVFTESKKNESIQFSNKEVSFSDQLRNRSPYALIRQTRFCHKSVFFPNNFIHIALSTWYNERYTLQPPERMNTSTGLNKQRLRGDNNFTIIADPNVDKLGCSIANQARTAGDALLLRTPGNGLSKLGTTPRQLLQKSMYD